MKIRMSLFELTELVRKTYNLPDFAELEVIHCNNPDAHKLETVFKEEGLIDISTGDIHRHLKIAAIKKLREIAASPAGTYSLSAAKNAIENWKQFFAYVSKNGFPHPTESESFPWMK